MCFPKINFDVRFCVCIPLSSQHTGSDWPEEKLFLPSPSLHLETKAEAERQTPVLPPGALAPLLRPHHGPLDLPGAARHHHCLHKVIKHRQSCQQTFQNIFQDPPERRRASDSDSINFLYQSHTAASLPTQAALNLTKINQINYKVENFKTNIIIFLSI